MQIPSLIWILHLMNLSKSQDSTNILRGKRSSSVSTVCQAGCATCSALNGCLSCKPRFFFHLELDGMRQKGTCLSSCPRGHYGVRSPHISTCTKCKADCASCFSENFCTRCHPSHFLFRGRCENSCPMGLTANIVLRECTECPTGCELCVRRNMCKRCNADMYHLHGQCHHTCPKGFEPDGDLMQCIPQIHCEVGEWTSWGQCAQKNTTKPYRRGEETRTRQVLRSPSVYGDPCPHVSEIRKCVIKKRNRAKL
ncbi:R-spondin-3-like [Melanotaenia boesemani]|uniref:R-spondin-3-like n=1 Tax=Melanotaenia boesemani TaxID=1250792 RepID=UPI001C052D47|nr:R-spondin-3-like [Melanotaenia boesemani]XP_041831653.1 R-spondin-3-like [Melanotaenia boesemani]XP_041831654.1 R-spondin-3-like [Melanotaenia boesemani]